MLLSVKLSLLCYILCLPCFTFYFVQMVDSQVFWSRASICGLAAVINLWCCLHWLFCNLYLQAASLFRLTFQTQSDEEFARLTRRKRWLHLVEVAGLCIFIVFTALFLIYAFEENSDLLLLITIEFSFLVTWPLTMSLMAYLSARHIDKNSRSIKQLGIRTNQPLMCAYIFFWFNETVFYTVMFICWCILYTQDAWHHPTL